MKEGRWLTEIAEETAGRSGIEEQNSDPLRLKIWLEATVRENKTQS